MTLVTRRPASCTWSFRLPRSITPVFVVPSTAPCINSKRVRRSAFPGRYWITTNTTTVTRGSGIFPTIHAWTTPPACYPISSCCPWPHASRRLTGRRPGHAAGGYCVARSAELAVRPAARGASTADHRSALLAGIHHLPRGSRADRGQRCRPVQERQTGSGEVVQQQVGCQQDRGPGQHGLDRPGARQGTRRSV